MSIDLNAIKARAEAATPGPWSTYAAYGSRGVEVVDTEDMLFIQDGGVTYATNAADAEFIATVNPQVVLALVAEVERLTEDDEHLREIIAEHEALRPEYVAHIEAARAQRDELAAKVAAIRTVAFDPDTVSALEHGVIGTPPNVDGLSVHEAIGYGVEALRDIRAALGGETDG